MKIKHGLLIYICLLWLISCEHKTNSNYYNSSEKITSENTIVENEENIRKYIQSLGRSFATSNGMFQNIKGFDYQGKILIINVETNSNFIKPSIIDENKEIEKEEILAKFKFQIWKGDSTFRDALRELVERGISGEIHYKGTKHSDGVGKINLSINDLREVAENKIDPTKEVLEAQVKALNIHMPVKADYCTIMDKMSISDGYLTYDYIIIEEEVPLSYFKENIGLVEKNLRQKLFSQCDDDLMHQAKSQGLGYRYRYKGDKSKTSFSIKFENSELK